MYVNNLNEDGKDIIHTSIDTHLQELVKLGINDFSIVMNNFELLTYLIENNNLTINDVLEKSSHYNNIEMVKFFIEKNADIHIDDDVALMNAIDNNNFEIVKYLIYEGANIHDRNDGPIIRACENRDI